MAWQNPKSNKTLGIIAAISVQAVLVAALVIGLKTNFTFQQPPDLIGVEANDPVPEPHRNEPKIDLPKNPDPTVDERTIHEPEILCEDCGKTDSPGPRTDMHYPTPALGSGKPDYPAPDKRLGHEGVVVVHLCVDERGNASGAALKDSSGYPTMDRAAVEWAQRIKWRPGMIEGRASAMCFDQPYRFRLDNQ